YLVYNFLRFGNPLDPGYAYINYNGLLKERVVRYGVFSTKYFLFNCYSFFIKGFNVVFQGPGLLNVSDMDLWGTSLLSSSPFLVASLRTRWTLFPRMMAWVTILLVLLGQLFYHNNGYVQIN